MSLHKEISFEDEICDHLGANGWLYAASDATNYDRARALFSADVIDWIQSTQSDAWTSLTKTHGAGAGEAVLTRLRDQIDQRGTLDVLRNGIEMLGLSSKLKLAEFKPAFAINLDILDRYNANRLRVVRQVRYSQHNENCIDLVLFLNGIPVATLELKTDFTQSIGDAVDQYKYDRIPSPKGQSPEPLLSFPNGALVHFAVSNREVQMTTRLAGPQTFFLPFNLGDNGAKGNPINSKGGHRTAYLWEDVLERESWLEILGRYIIAELDAKKQIEKLIFPRYHQLDVTRKLQRAVLADGPGARYLVQHSAGSGKTNSIAWSAHFLAELHRADSSKVFDSVLVVSDRNVIDGQLQDALFAFQRKTGVVATIKGESGSKSAELTEALKGDKKIVVCTIQTFPFALEEVRKQAATEGKRFAVIADEAHSSQTGEAASKLKDLLSALELKELADGGELSSEDILAAQMASRASDDRGITFVAFTATPKGKTMELFGTRPDPTRKPAPDNKPAPFHVYSMRQAIEEGFILDVLRNYTSYSLAFKLAHEGKDLSDNEVERSAAMKGIMGWVRLHPYNIAQKVEVIIEHYREFVAPLLNGKAKAMIVVASRLEAVRWQQAVQKYIASRGYQLKSLVAFSGEVIDPEASEEGFTEASKTLNPGLKGRDIREAFKGDEYALLLVANKFQTGFDQPLLCGMYVDKRLDGIQAVQTLSRLNRWHPGKDTTYVVDFQNEPDDVLAAFKTYYETATLETTTDPNLVYDLRAKLDATGYYDEFEVDRVFNALIEDDKKQSKLFAALEPVADRLLKKYSAAKVAWRDAVDRADTTAAQSAKDSMDVLTLFKTDMGTYVRLYTFLSQVFDYGNTAIEKRAIFFKHLERLLEFGREREKVDLTGLAMTHHTLKNRGYVTMKLDKGIAETLQPLTDAGAGSVQAREKARLAEIIEKVNDLFIGDITDQDKLSYVNSVVGKLLESKTLQQQAQNNSKEQMSNSPDLGRELTNAVIDSMDAHTSMATQALNSPAVMKALTEILMNHVGLYEGLRAR